MNTYSKNIETEQCTIPSVSSYILISKCKRQDQYKISSKHPILKNEYVKVDVSYDFLVFSVPTIDYLGKMYKTSINNNNSDWRQFSITNELLITGKFEIDTEESTEDELVVYYR